ncbi:histidinol-phosphate aminotransferase family protein, partial [Streptomyces sp. NPDC005386]
MPAQMPPVAMPAPAQPAGLQPAAAQTGMPGMANAASLGAQGGLTAAQVRGRTQPEPPPPPQSTGGWGAVGAMLYNQAG